MDFEQRLKENFPLVSKQLAQHLMPGTAFWTAAHPVGCHEPCGDVWRQTPAPLFDD